MGELVCQKCSGTGLPVRDPKSHCAEKEPSEKISAGRQAEGPDARPDLREGGLPLEEAEERSSGDRKEWKRASGLGLSGYLCNGLRTLGLRKGRQGY